MEIGILKRDGEGGGGGGDGGGGGSEKEFANVMLDRW